MKDLFTLAEARGRGVGRTLMAFLARQAMERGCVRFDWTAETDNPEALAFYDRLGARRVAEKVYYRFEGETLRQFAEGASAE
jgi:ribosomal protein S18 acetylase RimI-like enzyme